MHFIYVVIFDVTVFNSAKLAWLEYLNSLQSSNALAILTLYDQIKGQLTKLFAAADVVQ